MGNTHPVGGRSSGDNGVSTTNQMIQTSRGRVSGPSTSRPSRNADGIKTCSDLASSEPPDTTAQVQDILKRAAESKRPQFLDKNEAAHAGKAEDNIDADALGKGPPNAQWDVEDLAIRDITFWKTGFTVGDGHLRLYGDPESDKMLQAIQEGTAPTDLLNVRIGQSVELRVHKRLDEDYVSPPPESLSEARDLSGDSAEPPDTIAQVQDILKRAAESKSPQFLDKNEATHAGKAENNIESDAVQSQGKGVPNAEWEVEDLAVCSITFWRTGFTVGDGHLRLYGDPESNKILQSIQEGTAPTDLFNVRIGQPVELRVHKRLDEDYVSPPPESLSEARDLSGDSVLSQRPLSRRHLPDE